MGNSSYSVSYMVPDGTSGVVSLPIGNGTGVGSILLDGVVVDLESVVVNEEAETVVVSAVGGNHTFLVEL